MNINEFLRPKVLSEHMLAKQMGNNCQKELFSEKRYKFHEFTQYINLPKMRISDYRLTDLRNRLKIYLVKPTQGNFENLHDFLLLVAITSLWYFLFLILQKIGSLIIWAACSLRPMEQMMNVIVISHRLISDVLCRSFFLRYHDIFINKLSLTSVSKCAWLNFLRLFTNFFNFSVKSSLLKLIKHWTLLV